MSVEQVEIIDFIGINKDTGKVVLTISDHLDWADSHLHLQKLQDKLNSYLRFCESGELYKTYPDAKGRNVVLSIAAKYPFSPEGEAFFSKAKISIERAGFSLELV
ncbi:MAG: hypothetical protein HZA50_03830 [Planctomycetes bacterium]|nr:hypothetical protein [Planctomycetota bacterium]